MPRPRRRGWTAVSRITASTSAVRAPDWRWGFRQSRRPHPFREARTPGSRQGDSSFAHSWALAIWPIVARRRVAMLAPEFGPGGQVAGHGEGLGGQGREAHLAAPAGEQSPLGVVGAAGVAGEDRLQGLGHPLVGGPELGQGEQVDGGRRGRRRRWSWRVSGDGISGAVSRCMKDAR